MMMLLKMKMSRGNSKLLFLTNAIVFSFTRGSPVIEAVFFFTSHSSLLARFFVVIDSFVELSTLRILKQANLSLFFCDFVLLCIH